MLRGKEILLGVTGGIAAYKALELVRLLVKDGADVGVIMTAAAREFVTPLSFETLSGKGVYTGTFDTGRGPSTFHIDLADKANIFIIAPATANTIGKIATGIADDLLTTIAISTTAPFLIAPAMNVNMYNNPVVQGNIKKLKKLGFNFIGPEEGGLACGYEGKGRMSEPLDIREAAIGILTPKDLVGERILITAGPTREFIDPVRFISNPSTGKMGFAMARIAKHRGAEVTLISGDVPLRPPSGVEFIKVTAADEMRNEILKRFEKVSVVIMSAAVGDFLPKETKSEKIKKQKGFTLEFNLAPDILKELGAKKDAQTLIGFAAETERLDENAQKKFLDKNLDLIVANNLKDPDSGFGADTNRVTLIDGKGVERLPLLSKEETAYRVLDWLVRRSGKKPLHQFI